MGTPQPRNVFVKIKIPFDKVKIFLGLYQRLLSAPFIDTLKGYSQEGDKHAIILSIPMNGDAKSSLDLLSSVVVGLIDYYPCISEQPSEKQSQNVGAFTSLLKEKVLA